MPQVRPTSFGDILLALQARLMSVLSWPKERVLIDARKRGKGQQLPQQAQQYVRLRWGNSRFDLRLLEGAGRYGCFRTVETSCELWTWLGLDDPNQSGAWLTDPSLGHAIAEQGMWNALVNFQPSDSQANWLVGQPMQPSGGQHPEHDQESDGWGFSVASFSVSYLMNLDVTYI